MSRPLQQTFKCDALGELSRQLLFAPPAKRIEQVYRTERLHDEIDATCNYPLDYLIYRITAYRRVSDDNTLLVGEAVRPDLRLIIDRLSKSVELTPREGEIVETVAELARRLNISTKTVNRWRKTDLRWRWIVSPTTQKHQLVLPRAAVEHFTALHPTRVAKASDFTQIAPPDRQRIIDRARRLAQAHDVSLNQVATHLARKTGRALETIRLILEKHDQRHPDAAIFTNRTGPLTTQQKRVIARAYRMGVSVGKLAARFDRTRPTIYRAIKERRAARAKRMDLAHISLPIFDRDDADAVILRPDQPANETTERPTQLHIENLPPALQPLYDQPLIPSARQRSLFIRYNYLLHKASRLRDSFTNDGLHVAQLDAFDACIKQAADLRTLLFRSNMPAVLSVAKRHLIGRPGDTSQILLELLEAGTHVLADAVVSFNASRPATFESFLTNKLLQHFAGALGQTGSQRQARRRITPEEARTRILAAATAHGIDLLSDTPS